MQKQITIAAAQQDVKGSSGVPKMVRRRANDEEPSDNIKSLKIEITDYDMSHFFNNRQIKDCK